MSKQRILTTHAGSLPRPAKLVELYANRARGKPIDEDELVREGEAATSWVVERQREAGIHIPSDGEQLREAFFLYVQRRMTGFSGKWKRPHGDELAAYPEYWTYGGAKSQTTSPLAISHRPWRRARSHTQTAMQTKRN